MADIFNNEKRSEIMRKVKSKKNIINNPKEYIYGSTKKVTKTMTKNITSHNDYV